MTKTQKWTPCDKPEIGDTLKWTEPLWAEPNKPRGKRDKVGEQKITAKLTAKTNTLEFKVINVQKLSSNNACLNVHKNDYIKRKQSSIDKGACHKLVNY